MRVIADLHIHSKYSRAVSKDMDLGHLDLWAGKKGITVMGTGDFTHPAWFKELKEKLVPAEEGLYKLGQSGKTRFLLTVEISNIYKKGGKVRKVHNIVLMPSLEAAEKFNAKLSLRGNLASDGRPILGLDSKELLSIMLGVEPAAMLIPAHAWTPWFSIFGSMSGFDSIEECFDELTPHIKAIETGLSSDPAMNWRLSALDKVALVSNSDAHSPAKIGREANVLKAELSYRGIVDAITSNDPVKFLFTVEFFPEEGKYHYDGHRACEVSMKPAETKKLNLLCPGCGRRTTVGVLHRVEALADRPEGHIKPNAVPFKSMIPLVEIIGDAFGVGPASKRVGEAYESLVGNLDSEFAILLEKPISDIEKVADSAVAEAVRRVREGKVEISPGYDGVYGKIRIFLSANDRTAAENQTALF